MCFGTLNSPVKMKGTPGNMLTQQTRLTAKHSLTLLPDSLLLCKQARGSLGFSELMHLLYKLPWQGDFRVSLLQMAGIMQESGLHGNCARPMCQQIGPKAIVCTLYGNAGTKPCICCIRLALHMLNPGRTFKLRLCRYKRWQASPERSACQALSVEQ